MYAIIETGGKQLKVEKGQKIFVEKLDVEEGKYTFENVLMISGDKTVIGSPYVKGAKVVCSFVEHGRNKKIIVFKYRPKKGYKKKKGHRQPYTKLIVEDIIA